MTGDSAGGASLGILAAFLCRTGCAPCVVTHLDIVLLVAKDTRLFEAGRASEPRTRLLLGSAGPRLFISERAFSSLSCPSARAFDPLRQCSTRRRQYWRSWSPSPSPSSPASSRLARPPRPRRLTALGGSLPSCAAPSLHTGWGRTRISSSSASGATTGRRCGSLGPSVRRLCSSPRQSGECTRRQRRRCHSCGIPVAPVAAGLS